MGVLCSFRIYSGSLARNALSSSSSSTGWRDFNLGITGRDLEDLGKAELEALAYRDPVVLNARTSNERLDSRLHHVHRKEDRSVPVLVTSADLSRQVDSSCSSLRDVGEHTVEGDQESNVLARFKLSNELDLHDLGKVKEGSLVIVATCINIRLDIRQVDKLNVSSGGVEEALSGLRFGISLHLTHHTLVDIRKIRADGSGESFKLRLGLSDTGMFNQLPVSESSSDVRNCNLANRSNSVKSHRPVLIYEINYYKVTFKEHSKI